jgi:hypothetical protein
MRLGLRFCIYKWLLIRLELWRCIYTVTYAFRTASPELLRVSGSAPRHAIRALLPMRGDPLLYIHLFVDSVGVTVLYIQMAVDSVGVTALYIHGGLCTSGLRSEHPTFYAWWPPLCIFTCLLIRLGLRFCIDKWLLIRLGLRSCIYTAILTFGVSES